MHSLDAPMLSAQELGSAHQESAQTESDTSAAETRTQETQQDRVISFGAVRNGITKQLNELSSKLLRITSQAGDQLQNELWPNFKESITEQWGVVIVSLVIAWLIPLVPLTLATSAKVKPLYEPTLCAFADATGTQCDFMYRALAGDWWQALSGAHVIGRAIFYLVLSAVVASLLAAWRKGRLGNNKKRSPFSFFLLASGAVYCGLMYLIIIQPAFAYLNNRYLLIRLADELQFRLPWIILGLWLVFWPLMSLLGALAWTAIIGRFRTKRNGQQGGASAAS